MKQDRPRICAVITRPQPDLIRKIEDLADIFELRIDLIGNTWTKVVPYLNKPWIACNRSRLEGGLGEADESSRKRELLQALSLGASVIDIELSTIGLEEIVVAVKGKAQCLISHHNLIETPSFETLANIAQNEVLAGADICKVVTTAHSLEDSVTMLRLAHTNLDKPLISFAMGTEGIISRIISPLAGGWLTYASISRDEAIAPGQPYIETLAAFYNVLEK